jgi:hypothetical protein
MAMVWAITPAQRDAHHMGPVQPERVEQAVVQSTVAV